MNRIVDGTATRTVSLMGNSGEEAVWGTLHVAGEDGTIQVHRRYGMLLGMEGWLALRAFGFVLLLTLINAVAEPALGAEFLVRGFIENVMPHFDSNTSIQDLDMTQNSDQIFFARLRARIFFDFIANDDVRGVLALEQDSTFGAPRFNRVGARCARGDPPLEFEACGFRNGIDTNNLEVKHLYVDFRIPHLPVGNRIQIGGIPADVTPLHPYLLYTQDGGGGNVKLSFTDQVSVLLHYIQLEEDLDRFRGSAKVGEDYLTGMTLMLKPLPTLDLHLLGFYGHLQAPFGPSIQIGTGPFNNIFGDATNVATEDRYYLGFDARYRLGNLSLEPSFIYLLGSRKFCTPGSVRHLAGTLMPCTAAAGASSAVEFKAFETQLVARYTFGSWLGAGKFAYTSGNAAEDDINSRGLGRRSAVTGFRPLGVDGFHAFGEWFEILGRSDVDSLGSGTFLLPGHQGTFNTFGWMVVGAKAEYLASDRLILEGALGGFWTAERTACPALLRVGSMAGPCALPALDFTGDSRYAGMEIDVGLRYTILPGLIVTPRFGWAFLGDAWQTQRRGVQDAYTFVNRLIYIF